MEMGILKHSISPWAANNVFVPKKDHCMRVATDYQSLNNVRVSDEYPMEDVHGTLDWLSRKNCIQHSN